MNSTQTMIGRVKDYIASKRKSSDMIAVALQIMAEKNAKIAELNDRAEALLVELATKRV